MKGSGLMFVFLLLLLIFATVNNSQHCSSVTCSRDSSKNQSESEKVLTIGLLLPKEVSDQDEMSYYNRLDQVKMGLEVLTADPNSTNLGSYQNPLPSVLPGWKIKVITGDTSCSSTIGPLEAVKLHCEADVFLGPVCKYSLTVVSRFAAYWNKPVITTGGEQEGFRNKDGDYRLLTTISNIYTTELTELVVKFLKEKTDWKVLRFLFHNYPADEKPQKYSKCQQTLQTMFLTLGGGTQKGVMNHNLTFESFDQDNLTKSNIEDILKRVEKKARGKRHFIK